MIFLKLNPFTVLFFLFFLITFTTPSIAQERMIIGKRTTHKKSRTIIHSKEVYPKKSTTKNLAQQITKGKHSDADKAKSIFNWIATTIVYDNELRFDKNLQKEIYISEANVIFQALKRKKALCGGYAFLFKQLCADVGIKAEVVHGFTTQPNKYKNTSGKPEHTWNAVYLNGNWRLLDITWAISHGTPNKPNVYWYLTKASEFQKTHLAKDRQWSLLGNKITRR